VSRYVPKDSGYHRAKQAGYRSRAALKLVELNRRFRVLRPGLRVLDLGCWPGGWLQVTAQAVGPSGLVIGVDAKAVENLGLANVVTLVGDVTEPDVTRRLAEALGERADVVLSDLAPRLSGIREVDAARHFVLCEITLARCDALLKTGGAAVVKLFTDTQRDVGTMLSARFGSCAIYRPETTRRGSSEIYAVCKDFLRDAR
jgi:23S rRNA (uridine2552-2'-O)-methyltransferase